MSVPLFTVGFTFLFTAMLLCLLPEAFVLYFGVVAFVLFLISCIFRERTVMLVLASAFVACFLIFVKTEYVYKPVVANAGRTIEITGQMVDSDKLKVSSGELAGKTIKVTSKYVKLGLNDFVSFKAKLYALSDYSKAQNVYVGCTVYGNVDVTEYSDVYLSLPVYKRFSSFVRSVAFDLSAYLESTLLRNLPEDMAYVLFGMLIGDKSYLSDAIYEDFQQTGIVHLLAVSGFHTSLWSMLFYRFLLKRGVNMRLSAGFTILFVLAFLALTGFSKSTIRASIALIVFFLGRILSRQSDSKSSLGLAAIIILTVNPFAGGDMGFLLSFFSTLGILVIYPKMLAWFRDLFTRKIANRIVRDKLLNVVSIVLVTVSTLIFTLPVTMVMIGEVSLVSPLTNLLVTSVASTAIMLSGVAVLVSFVPVVSAFEKPLMLVSGLIIKYVLSVSSFVSTFSFATVDISSNYAMVTIAFVLILIGFSLILKASTKRTVLLSFVLVFVSLITHYLV
ncbi:MAG: ComEC/Rec2 family competence protein [Clostridia bacterium]|nr:ComEC/Rec2 family competence protein [Clostridia bacterium]